MKEKRSILWKIYFYIFLVFNVIGLDVFVNTYENMYEKYYMSEVLYEVFSLGVYLISILAVWGFIYKKRVFYKEFWVYVFFIMLIQWLGTSILGYSEEAIEINEFIVMAIGVITIFYFVSLYKYTFKMNELWRENE